MKETEEFLTNEKGQIDRLKVAPIQGGLAVEASGLVELQMSAESRNSRLETLLNPNGTLPKVELTDAFERHPLDSDEDLARRTYAVKADGRDVGTVFTHQRTLGDASNPQIDVVVSGIKLEKGRGYGKSTYLELIKSLPLGAQLRSDTATTTPDALKIWQWLESSGVASRQIPGELPPLDDQGRYPDLGFRTTL